MSKAGEKVQIRFADDASIPVVTRSNDGMVVVSFKDAGLREIFSRVTTISCEQSYPGVDALPHPLSAVLKCVYEFELSSGASELVKHLNAYKGSCIINMYVVVPPVDLALPDDYNTDIIPCGASQQPLRHLELIGAPTAWNITTGSADIRIAVMDNGFNKNHEDLLGKIVNAGVPTGFAAHGTMVLGLIAANTGNGIGQSAIGYNCRLLAYETGLNHFPAAIMAGAKVINCSWYTSCTFNQNEQDMINLAYEMGVVVVAAAGNGGTCGGPTNYVYPAAYDHVIAVTGVGHNFDRGEQNVCNGKINHKDVHVYRAHKDAPIQTLQHHDKIDLAAPAYEVRGLSLSSYWNNSGTSFASPIVAGASGLLFSVYSEFTPADIEGILKCTAYKLDTITDNAPYRGLLGAGRLDAGKAVQKANEMLGNKPVDIQWYYYNRKGYRVKFDPGVLYQHIRYGTIAGNTIYAEAVSKTPGMDFEWEFTKANCTIRKTGNPVSFNLVAECPDFWYTMTARVKNKVTGICDPNAGIPLAETVLLEEDAGCWQGYKAPVERDTLDSFQLIFPGNIGIPGVTLTPELKRESLVTPNPSNGTIFIRSHPLSGLKGIQVLNAAGQVIWQKKYSSGVLSNITVDLASQPNGMYFIKLMYPGKVITERIVKRS